MPKYHPNIKQVCISLGTLQMNPPRIPIVSDLIRQDESHICMAPHNNHVESERNVESVKKRKLYPRVPGGDYMYRNYVCCKRPGVSNPTTLNKVPSSPVDCDRFCWIGSIITLAAKQMFYFVRSPNPIERLVFDWVRLNFISILFVEIRRALKHPLLHIRSKEERACGSNMKLEWTNFILFLNKCFVMNFHPSIVPQFAHTNATLRILLTKVTPQPPPQNIASPKGYYFGKQRDALLSEVYGGKHELHRYWTQSRTLISRIAYLQII